MVGTSLRLRHVQIQQLPSLYWNGEQLIGSVEQRDVHVLLPARLVSFRHEMMPAAATAAIYAAIRLRAARLFSSLGAVRVDALIQQVSEDQLSIVMLAMPETVLNQIVQAAQDQGKQVKAIQVAELLEQVPDGGVVCIHNEAVLFDFDTGVIKQVCVLGAADDAQYAARLERERLRLGIQDQQTGGAIKHPQHNFLAPCINAKPAWWKQRSVRLGGIAAASVLMIALLVIWDVFQHAQARDAALAQLEQLEPLANKLQQRREEMKAHAVWFDDRLQMTPALHLLSQHLPALNETKQIYLSRVRLTQDSNGIAEGIAHDRETLLAFIERLRQNKHIAAVTLRSSRNQDKRSQSVVFELIVRLADHVVQDLQTASKGVDDATS